LTDSADSDLSIDLRAQTFQVLRVLRDRWWVIAAVAVATTLGAFLQTRVKDPQYEATATLLYNPPEPAALIASSGLPPEAFPALDPSVTLSTLAEIGTTDSVRRRAEAKIGPISEAVSVTKAPESNVLNVKATASDARRAGAVSNAWAEAFVERRSRDSKEGILEAIVRLRRDIREETGGVSERRLRARLTGLRRLVPLKRGDLELAREAPSQGTRISNPQRDVLIGGFAGLLLGLAVVAVIEILDRRLKTVLDVERAWNAPVLASLTPVSSTGIGTESRNSAEAEAFRRLRVNMSFASPGHDMTVVAITSATEGEGKSAAALRFSLALAASGKRVLLIDADFQHRQLTEQLKLGTRGLPDVLAGAADLGNVVRRIELGDQRAPGDGEHLSLHAVGAGPTDGNLPELLSGGRLASSIRSLSGEWDHVLLDCAPLLPLNDTLYVVAASDGVLVAQRLYYSRVDAARTAAELIERAGRPILGVVAATDRRSFGGDAAYGSRPWVTA
jgi:Mrp family chromosome partitioning ATPase/capsular polysaccharide biosynthesis protein